MQVTNFAQPSSVVQTPVAANKAVNGNTEQLSNSVSPATDTLSISSSKIMIAQQVVTQQIEIALDIKVLANSSQQNGGNQNPVDQLLNKVVQKIHDEKASNTNDVSADEKHSAAVKSVRVKVAQGFESASLALTRLGVVDNSVAANVDQTRSRVDAVIDQVASQPATVETAAVNMVSAKRDLSSSLQLTTREGDVVTINFSRSQAVTAGSASGPAGSVAYASGASSSLIEISIQGDLSEKESKSISKVVESISKLAEKLFNGNTGAAMEKLSELSINTETLASMSLNMSSSFSYQAMSAYAQVSRLPVESAPVSAQSTTVAPATSSVVSNTANNQVASAVPASSQAVAQQAAVAPDGSTAAPVIGKTAAVVNDAVTSNAFENPFNALRDLFAQMADMFASAQNNVTDQHRSFVSELFNSVVDKTEESHDEKNDSDNEVTNLAA